MVPRLRPSASNCCGFGEDAPSPLGHHDCPPTSISSFAARNFFDLPSSIPPSTKIIPFLDFNSTHIPLLFPIFNSTFNSQIHPKCLPRLLRKSPPLAARPPLARPPPRRRKPARRPPHPRVTRKSAIRHERRPTLRTSTKVRYLALVLIPESRLNLALTWPHCQIILSFQIISRRVLRFDRMLTRLFLVLKQVHPDTGISNRAMSILNSFVNDIFERVATEASKLAAYNKKSTISSREIQTS